MFTIAHFLTTVRRHYIALARSKRPTVPPQVSSYVVDSYVRLRKLSKEEEEQNKSHSYTSARTLLGILRLAQALARLRCADVVAHPDVDEALRLMECSKESLQEDSDKEHEPDKSAVSQVFRLIKGMASGENKPPPKVQRKQKRLGKGPGGERDMDVDDSEEEDTDELSMVDIRARVMNAGWSEVVLMETISQVCFSLVSQGACHDLLLSQYEDLDVWVRVANGSKLRFI